VTEDPASRDLAVQDDNAAPAVAQVSFTVAFIDWHGNITVTVPVQNSILNLLEMVK
jgi:hypothetical protein